MTESKHTPGPWEAEGAGKSSWIKGSDGNWAALACGTDDENANANGLLIAAAPDLLFHLKSAVSALEAYGIQCGGIPVMKATISRAEGLH